MFDGWFDKEFVNMITAKGLKILAIVSVWLIAIFILKKLFAFLHRKYDTRRASTLYSVLRYVLFYAVAFVAIYQILLTLGINVTGLVTIAGVGSVIVGFGMQTIVKDFVSGVLIIMEDQYNVGDYVEINNRLGIIEELNLRTTIIRSLDGDQCIIPNGEVRMVDNLSKEYNRAIVDIGISYEENIKRAIDSIQNELQLFHAENDKLIRKPIVKGVQELGETAVLIRVTADCQIGEHWNIERELRARLKTRFDKDKIKMPYSSTIIEFSNPLRQESYKNEK